MSLKITSEVLKPERITDLLGLEPVQAFPKGSLIDTNSKHSAARSAAVWLWETAHAPEDGLQPRIKAVLQVLESRRSAVDVLAGSSTVEVIAGCGFADSQEVIIIDHELLGKLGSFPVALVVDVYS